VATSHAQSNWPDTVRCLLLTPLNADGSGYFKSLLGPISRARHRRSQHS
jgi:hypothetical protein